MAKFCTFYSENPYEPCLNLAVKGTYRCEEHPKVQPPGRSGDMTSKVRASILARDNHKCVRCGGPATEVNHIIPFSTFSPESQPKANLPDNLESLCMSCHAVETKKQRIAGIQPDDTFDFSTSARNRKKKRRRKQGYHY